MKSLSLRNIHYGYVIILCCCLIMGVDVGLVMSCAGIFYAPVSESLGIDIGSFSIYMSIAFISSSLMLSAAGKIMSRYGARKLLTLSSLVLGLTVVAMGCFSSVWAFYAAGVVIGITLAFLLYLSFPTLINTWFNVRAGMFIGICSAASGIGGIVFNPIGGWLISSYGWRAAYIVFGVIIACVVTPLIGVLLRNTPEDKGLLPVGSVGNEASDKKDIQVSVTGVDYSKAVKMPVLYVIVLFAFILMACSTFNLFIPKYVISDGFSIEQSALAAAAVMAGVTGGKLVLGIVNDRNCTFGVLITTLFGAAGLCMLIFFPGSFWVILVGSFLFGWEYAGCTVQTAMITSKVFGRKDYAKIYSIVSMALAAGGGIASGVWGYLAEATSFSFAFGVGTVMLLLACIIGVVSLATASRKVA